MNKFDNHKYEYTVLTGTPTHSWSLIGPEGGIQFRSRAYSEGHTVCGLEYHASGRSALRSRGKAPSHLDCWLIKETCWHDGASTLAMELWPMVKGCLERGNHEAVWRILEAEYCKYFMDHAEEGQ